VRRRPLGAAAIAVILTAASAVAAAGSGPSSPAAPAPAAGPAARAPAKSVRARDLGIPFDGTPGPLNAITDVAGIEVGHSTIIRDDKGRDGAKTAVRTGVTAIYPRGAASDDLVFAGWAPLNGNGELTGTTWVKESGFLEGPVMFTNTHSVGVVHDAVIEWRVRSGKADASGYYWSLPVVGETWDGWLNDTNGFHVKRENVFEALSTAAGGAVKEGSVGGGTGNVCYEFKGGIGTSSRRLPAAAGGYTVGVIVQCNCGLRPQLTIAGVPVGREITGGAIRQDEYGSILILIGTDAPLLPHQLERLARRAPMGLARTGSVSMNGSGDLILAFSTANPHAAAPEWVASLKMLPNDRMNRLFEATVHATEEAIVNALVAGETMSGIDNRTVLGMPEGRVVEILRKYNRIPAGPP